MQKPETEKRFEQDIVANKLLIWKVCHIYARTAANRQDLFQEIIIQLWKAYPRFRNECKLSTWLYRVAINTAISDLRKQKGLIEPVDPTTLPLQLSDAADTAVLEEQTLQLYTAIDRLNEVEKAIVMLYLEDKSYEEMQDILGINSGNLRVKMNRIKEKLRQLTKNN